VPQRCREWLASQRFCAVAVPGVVGVCKHKDSCEQRGVQRYVQTALTTSVGRSHTISIQVAHGCANAQCSQTHRSVYDQGWALAPTHDTTTPTVAPSWTGSHRWVVRLHVRERENSSARATCNRDGWRWRCQLLTEQVRNEWHSCPSFLDHTNELARCVH